MKPYGLIVTTGEGDVYVPFGDGKKAEQGINVFKAFGMTSRLAPASMNADFEAERLGNDTTSISGFMALRLQEQADKA